MESWKKSPGGTQFRGKQGGGREKEWIEEDDDGEEEIGRAHV